ncbi:OmpA family protein [Roseomonas alkaliterrae]|nr:OmpA family protein [Neoroseomonas alkaliterrae]
MGKGQRSAPRVERKQWQGVASAEVEAAQARTTQPLTRIEVNGHTDTSGPARYNQGLSERRAAAVAAELVRLGVPRHEIVTRGLGQTQPMVPTPDNTREPQNRRVEIVLR